MKLIIGTTGKNPTVKYAYDELARLLKAMDAGLYIDLHVYKTADMRKPGVLWLCTNEDAPVTDKDEIYIHVQNGCGVIRGSNPRALLIAVYRFMTALGCRFLYPGANGEVIPQKTLTEKELCVFVDEKPSFRHRGVCVEGAFGYTHARNMVEWLPKVGMNALFVQLRVPGAFFRRVYGQDPNYSDVPLSDEDVPGIISRLEEDVALRGLQYHAMGHGWTCETFGMPTTDWEVYQGEVPAETKQYLAEIDGVRDLWKGKPLNTNLCYSNPVVRDRLTDAVLEYCLEHPRVNYLHFWLADDKNNHCECEKCREKIPSDYYVMLLNEMDKKLTAAGVQTKVVCLVYEDLLWAPEREVIENPDRFVLMFAPVSRTYSTSYAAFDTEKKFAVAPYVRNRLTMPSSVEELVAMLPKWRAMFNGDSFDFDYHMMWDHFTDPGYWSCAKILHEDVTNLDKLGLKGLISCQSLRVAFPTGLPMYAMAKGLWDKNSKFSDVASEYFTAAYGEDAKIVENYLSTLSALFDPAYMRGDKAKDAAGQIVNYEKAKEVIAQFCAAHIAKNAETSPYWKTLQYHADLCLRYADVVIKCFSGVDEAEKERAKDAFTDYIYSIEPMLHELFDAVNFDWSYRKYLKIVENL